MKKKLFSILLVLVLALSLIACGSSDDDAETEAADDGTQTEAAGEEDADADESSGDVEEIDVGVLVWKYDDTWGSTVRIAIEKYFEELSPDWDVKVNLTMQNGNDDQATQNDQADVMLETGVDVLIVNLCDPAAGQTIADKAKAYEVPLVYYNIEPVDPSFFFDYPAETLFVGTQIEQAGEMQGQILYDLWEENPEYDRNGDGVVQYLQFMGTPNNPEAIARTEYSVKEAENLGLELELVNGEVIIANWDTAQANEAMNAVWASHGDKIEAVFCNNDDMAMGVIATLNGVGWNLGDDAEKYIPIIGVDATDAAYEAIKNGRMEASVIQDGTSMGKTVVETTLNIATGRDKLDGTGYELNEDGFSIRMPYGVLLIEDTQ